MSIRFQTSRFAAAIVLAGSLAAMPAFADTATTTTTTTAPADDSTPAKPMMHHKGHGNPEEMSQRVEERIKTLHVKLMITPEQESDWNNVAQAMRDSETQTSSLIQKRHQSTEPMTAVEDLESYQKIAQAHADGLDKVVSAFSTLYNEMSDEQKANADKVFGGYEGHGPGHAGKKPASN